MTLITSRASCDAKKNHSVDQDAVEASKYMSGLIAGDLDIVFCFTFVNMEALKTVALLKLQLLP